MLSDVLPSLPTPETNTVAYWLGLIFVAVGGWAGIKAGFAKFQRVASMADALDSKLAAFAQVEANIKVLMAEMKPNGGSTLRDRLESGVNLVSNIGTRLASVEAVQRAGMSSGYDGAFIANGDGRINFASGRMCEFLGVSKDEILGDSWRDLVHPDDRARVLPDWDSFIGQRRRKFESSYRYVRPNGDITSVECRAVRESDTEGKVIQIVGSIRRVTGVH